MDDILYLKGSSIPGRGKTQLGDCIKSQRIWMIVKLKNLENTFDIRFLDEKTKQTDPEFKKFGSTMVPVLRHRDIEYDDADEIAYHLEKHFPDPPLETPDIEANALAGTATPMSSLNGWIINKDPEKEKGLAEKFHKSLGEINDKLGKKEGPFLCGEELKFPDCILLPKLYRAKVSALYTKGYDFTKRDSNPEFENIRKYMKAAQANAVFQESCPSEEEIREKWKDYKSGQKHYPRKS